MPITPTTIFSFAPAPPALAVELPPRGPRPRRLRGTGGGRSNRSWSSPPRGRLVRPPSYIFGTSGIAASLVPEATGCPIDVQRSAPIRDVVPGTFGMLDKSPRRPTFLHAAPTASILVLTDAAVWVRSARREFVWSADLGSVGAARVRLVGGFGFGRRSASSFGHHGAEFVLSARASSFGRRIWVRSARREFVWSARLASFGAVGFVRRRLRIFVGYVQRTRFRRVLRIGTSPKSCPSSFGQRRRVRSADESEFAGPSVSPIEGIRPLRRPVSEKWSLLMQSSIPATSGIRPAGKAQIHPARRVGRRRRATPQKK